MQQIQRSVRTCAAVESQTTKSPNKWGFRTSSSPFPRADSLPVIRSHPDAHDGVDLEFGPQGWTRTSTVSGLSDHSLSHFAYLGLNLQHADPFHASAIGIEMKQVDRVLAQHVCLATQKHGGFEPRHLTDFHCLACPCYEGAAYSCTALPVLTKTLSTYFIGSDWTPISYTSIKGWERWPPRCLRAQSLPMKAPVKELSDKPTSVLLSAP